MEIKFKCCVKPTLKVKDCGLGLSYNLNYFVNSDNRIIVGEYISPIIFDEEFFEKMPFYDNKFDIGDVVIVTEESPYFQKGEIYRVDYIDEKNNMCKLEGIYSYTQRSANIFDLKHAFYYWYIDDEGLVKNAIYGVNRKADTYRRKTNNMFDSKKEAYENID